MTDRLPVIITKAIDLLCRQRKQIPALLSLNEKDYNEAEEETKSLIEELARLKYELQTDKTIKALDSDYSDTKEWNEILKREENSHANEEVTWFNISWLYAECYLYRRMREIFLLSKHFKQFDQFYLIKEEAFFNAHHFASNLATHLLKITDLLAQQSLKDLFYFYVMVKLYSFHLLFCFSKNAIIFRLHSVETSAICQFLLESKITQLVVVTSKVLKARSSSMTLTLFLRTPKTCLLQSKNFKLILSLIIQATSSSLTFALLSFSIYQISFLKNDAPFTFTSRRCPGLCLIP